MNASGIIKMKNKVVIVHEKHLDQKYPGKTFWIRTEDDKGVNVIDLPGSLTPTQALEHAKSLGYNPTHYTVFGSKNLQQL
jgi:hypothetical protein